MTLFFVTLSNDATLFYNIIQEAKKLTQKPIKYLFLDEVQAINGWERFVKSVYDSEELPFEVDEKTIITYNQNKTIENIEVVSFYEYFWRNS